MSSSTRSLLAPTAVYVGAVVLVGLPVTSLLSSVFGVVLESVGAAWILDGAGSLVVLAVSLLVGLQLAVEVAALQLGGLAALERGSPRIVLARTLGLAASTLAVLTAVAWLGLSAAAGGYGPEIVVLGLLVVVTAILVWYRSAGAFVAGLRSGEA